MSFKGWLTLSLAVLLIHLSLLQSLPLSLRQEAPQPQAFATRVIVQAPALPPPPLTKPAPKPQHVPVETSSSPEQESVDAAPSPEPAASEAAIAETPELTESL